MFSTVGPIWEGRKGQQSHAQDVSKRMGQSHPKFFFSRPPSMFGLNCRAEKSLQLWFFLDEMEITHAGYHGTHTGDTHVTMIGMGSSCQDTTTYSPNGSFLFSTEFLAKVLEPSGYLKQKLCLRQMGNPGGWWFRSLPSVKDVAKLCHHSSPLCSSSPSSCLEPSVLPDTLDKQIPCAVATKFSLPRHRN